MPRATPLPWIPGRCATALWARIRSVGAGRWRDGLAGGAPRRAATLDSRFRGNDEVGVRV